MKEYNNNSIDSSIIENKSSDNKVKLLYNKNI